MSRPSALPACRTNDAWLLRVRYHSCVDLFRRRSARVVRFFIYLRWLCRPVSRSVVENRMGILSPQNPRIPSSIVGLLYFFCTFVGFLLSSRRLSRGRTYFACCGNTPQNRFFVDGVEVSICNNAPGDIWFVICGFAIVSVGLFVVAVSFRLLLQQKEVGARTSLVVSCFLLAVSPPQNLSAADWPVEECRRVHVLCVRAFV